MGINAHSGQKLLLSLGFIAVTYLIARLLRAMAYLLLRNRRQQKIAFWTRQAISLLGALLLLLGLISIWFDEPGRLATAAGLFTAGLVFALQRVVTALAGYVLILRGKTFNVGDRITMGGVRGDVIALGFLQTTIMEMGQPPAVQNADPAMWVKARQYSGRIVSVTNAKIFDEPVYNYTREFPFLWEEMSIPITYQADRAAAERIILDAVRRHTTKIAELSEPVLREMERRYLTRRAELGPRVYWRLTDNWLELTVRFIVLDHQVREVKDAISRDILAAFDQAGLHIASATLDLVHVPTLHLQTQPPPT